MFVFDDQNKCAENIWKKKYKNNIKPLIYLNIDKFA